MADSNRESREVFEALTKVLKDYRGDWDGLERDKQTGTLSFYINDKVFKFRPDVQRSSEDLSIKLTADVSDALVGLKALQRELRKTTQATREYEEALKDVPLTIDGEFRVGNPVKGVVPDWVGDHQGNFKYILSGVPTKDLRDELAMREVIRHE